MSNPTELPDLDRLEALARAATPGPWMRLWDERTVYDRMNDGCRGNAIVRADMGYSTADSNNLDFIAAANPAAVLALIAAARRAQPEGGDLRAEIEKLIRYKHCMSYNDSYFTEPAGMLRRVVFQLDRLLSAPAQAQPEGGAPDIEAAAKAIYELLPPCQGKSAKDYPWQPGGNSHKQEEAREYARAALAAQSQGAQAVIVGEAPTAASMIKDMIAAQQAAAPGHETIVREGGDLVCTACGTSAPGTPEAPSKTGQQLYIAWRQAQADSAVYAPWYRLDEETKAEWKARAAQLDGGQEVKHG